MITSASIESFVETKPSTTREVFSFLVASESNATREIIKSLEKVIKKYLAQEGIHIEPTPNWLNSICKQHEIEDLMLLLESADIKERKSLRAKLLNPLRPLLLKALGYILDLDYSTTSYEQQLQSGDALILACLYLHTQESL